MKARVFWIIAICLGLFYAAHVLILRKLFEGIPAWGAGVVFVLGTLFAFCALAIGTVSDPGGKE